MLVVGLGMVVEGGVFVSCCTFSLIATGTGAGLGAAGKAFETGVGASGTLASMICLATSSIVKGTYLNSNRMTPLPDDNPAFSKVVPLRSAIVPY